jgi:hypothetical protein
VVGVGVGFHRPLQRQAALLQLGQVALELLVDRIDDQRLARALVEQQVGVGAGGGIKPLDGSHRGSLGLNGRPRDVLPNPGSPPII